MVSKVMAGEVLEGLTVIGFDLETTGINIKSDRIIQFAFVGATGEDDEIMVEELVDPGRPIPPDSIEVHGIKDSDAVSYTHLPLPTTPYV